MKIRLYTLPNMITLLNLMSGCVAISVMLRHDNFKLGFALICLAAVFDFFDGFVARLTGSYSAVGKELDSLADIVSFGVAPAVALFSLILPLVSNEIYAYPIFILAGFATLRLAKFNIDESQKDTFVGLPTPAMAICVSSLAYIIARDQATICPYAVYTLVAVMCFLMVCNIEMFALKFSNFGFKGNQIRYGFIAFSVLSLVFFGLLAFPIIIATYVLISLVMSVSKKRKFDN